jgi:predicted ATPase
MTTAPPTSRDAAVLLERGPALAGLARELDEVMTGHGRLVFVEGEAGVGKTAVLRHFLAIRGHPARALWGACDPLFSPRPLGPFLDVAEELGGELSRTIESGAKPYDVAATLRRELAAAPEPTILVLDDMHWADEASLDVLRLVTRRVETLPVLVLAGYRGHEVGLAHGLRLVMGELASSRAVQRLHVEPPLATTRTARSSRQPRRTTARSRAHSRAPRSGSGTRTS